MKKILLLSTLFVFTVTINLKAQTYIDGTWHSEYSGNNFFLNYDAINDVVAIQSLSNGCLMIYEYNGVNPYDGNVDYICTFSSCNEGIGNILEIFNSFHLEVAVPNGIYAIWDKTYSTWYSEITTTWDPYVFFKLHPQAYVNTIPTNSKWNNITPARTKPNYGHPPTTHIVKSN